MGAIYKENIVDIELTSGNIHRSFLPRAIGKADNAADHFGIRVFRNGEPVNIEGVAVQGYFRDPMGNNIAITSGNIVSGNMAAVVLPQACYNYDGQFTLAIKLVGNNVTGTMRIVDGVVDNTNTGGAVAPTETVPTYEEILAVYEEMLEAKEGSVRFDITQELTDGQKTKARENIEAAKESDVSLNTESIRGLTKAEDRDRKHTEEKDNYLASIAGTKGETISTSADGVMNNGGGIDATGAGLSHATASVEKGKRYLVTGTTFTGSFPSYVLLKDSAVVFSAKIDALENTSEKLFVDRIIEIKDDCDTLVVNGYDGYTFINEFNNTVFCDLITIGNMSAGAKSKTLGTVTTETFINISASVKKGDTVIIAGVTFPNHDFPSYILAKNGSVVSYASLSDASVDTYFDSYELYIDEDADTIYVNGVAGHLNYVKAKERLSYSQDIGYKMVGVVSNGMGIVDDTYSTFRRIVAPIEYGKTYRIAGVTFQNTSFPSYVLLKDGEKVSTARIGDATSGDVYFINNQITITSDVDTIILNGVTGHNHYIKEVGKTVIGQAADAVYDYVLKPGTVVEGVHQNNPSGIISGVGSHTKLIVAPGQKLRLHAYQWQNTNFVSFLFVRNGQTVVWSPATSAYRTDTWNWIEIEVPYDANEVIVNGYSTSVPAEVYVLEPVDTKKYIESIVNPIKELDETNYWKGKKIVWFGTSIPAAGANPGDTVGNGSYPVRIGEKLGATVYNEAVGSSCVRFGNYQYATEGDPHGFAGQWLDNFLYSLSGSTEEKQEVFDNWDYWKDIIQSGGASSVTLTPEQIARALSCCYDVKLDRYLTGGDVGPVDLYVFDHGHNEEYNYDYSHIKDIPPEGHETDRSYFIGAMRFLIERILSDNPKAQIVFIGHYENDRKTGVSEAQETLHDIWKYPLIRTWDYIGWSQNTVTINGVTKTITQIWMPDDLHPSSDTTGEALRHYAEVLYPFVRDIR